MVRRTQTAIGPPPGAPAARSGAAATAVAAGASGAWRNFCSKPQGLLVQLWILSVPVRAQPVAPRSWPMTSRIIVSFRGEVAGNAGSLPSIPTRLRRRRCPIPKFQDGRDELPDRHRRLDGCFDTGPKPDRRGPGRHARRSGRFTRAGRFWPPIPLWPTTPCRYMPGEAPGPPNVYGALGGGLPEGAPLTAREWSAAADWRFGRLPEKGCRGSNLLGTDEHKRERRPRG